jgi:hypothetical protein
VTLAALPYALVSDLLFVLPLLLRCFLLPGRTASMLLTVWWLAPWLAALLAHAGGGGIAALLPLVALVGYYRLFRRQRFQIADHRAGDLGLGRSAGGDADLMGAT